MSELAQRAGTTKPTLYTRLGSKEQIYLQVLEREAELLKRWLFEAYELALNLPLDEMIETAMVAFFRFVDQRRRGFDLLFKSAQGGPGHDIGDRAFDEIIERVTGLFQSRAAGTGRRPAASGALLAAGSVGIARQMCEYALDNGYELAATGALATAFAQAAIKGVDVNVLARTDRAGAPSRRAGRSGGPPRAA